MKVVYERPTVYISRDEYNTLCATCSLLDRFLQEASGTFDGLFTLKHFNFDDNDIDNILGVLRDLIHETEIEDVDEEHK